MLPNESNSILTSVQAGTPGGNLMREYWLPVLISNELPAPDCPPLRIRLLGEDLIAFRTTSGNIGMIQNACPHRGASMFFGRNEDEGLRCVYHGWKFDVNGACVDMPSEPAESNFKSKVRTRAYPCIEHNGVVWTYMGDQSPPPPLPDLEWNRVPQDHSFVTKRVQACNWFQALEGAIDSAHSNFVHAPLNRMEAAGPRVDGQGDANATYYKTRVTYLHFETVNTDTGVIVANRRDAEADTFYWRANHYLLPFYTMFPPNLSSPDVVINGHAWVPIDDENTLVFFWSYNVDNALTEQQLGTMRHGRDGLDGFHLSEESQLPATSKPHGAWYPKQNAANDYMIDYEAQRTVRFSGVPGGWNQDAAVQESMGPVTNRAREHLGTSDLGIIAARRRFLSEAEAHESSKQPPVGVWRGDSWNVRPAAAIISRQADWLSAMRPLIDGSKTVDQLLVETSSQST